jgi:tripartite-type tricarboxylate transporter receptor subunit TctC
MTRSQFFLFVNPSVPTNTLAELMDYARANPGQLTYGTGNTTSILATAQLQSLAGVKMVQVPYKGDAPLMIDLLAGRVQLSLASTVPGLALAKEGKLRVLATLLSKRSPHLPDVPTMAEAGFPEYSVVPWGGLFGPARLPREIVERLTRDTNAILQRPEVREALNRQAFEGQGSTPEELGAFVKQQLDLWRRAAREAGIQPD